eukprot:4124234-Amphidinium_carterae.1
MAFIRTTFMNGCKSFACIMQPTVLQAAVFGNSALPGCERKWSLEVSKSSQQRHRKTVDGPVWDVETVLSTFTINLYFADFIALQSTRSRTKTTAEEFFLVVDLGASSRTKFNCRHAASCSSIEEEAPLLVQEMHFGRYTPETTVTALP